MTRRLGLRATGAAKRSTKVFDQTIVKSQVTDVVLVQRRREQIVSAAVDLFSKQGYYRTTLQEIARKAGVSIGLIYQYAETKEDVLLLSLMWVMETFKDEIARLSLDSDDPLASLHSTLATYCRVVDRHRNAAVLAYRSTMSLRREQREFIKQAELDTNELIARRLRACIDSGVFRKVDVDLVAYQLALYVHTWALKYWRLSQITSIEGYIEQGFDFFVRAMATPAGSERYARMLGNRSSAAKGRKRAGSTATKA